MGSSPVAVAQTTIMSHWVIMIYITMKYIYIKYDIYDIYYDIYDSYYDIYVYFRSGFFSQTFTIHRTAG